MRRFILAAGIALSVIASPVLAEDAAGTGAGTAAGGDPAGIVPAGTGSDPTALWGKVERTLGNAYEVREDSDFGPLTLDGSSAESRRIEALLSRAVDILSESDAKNEREELREIEAKMAEIREEIRQATFARAAAPKRQDSGFAAWLASFFTTDAVDYDRQIATSEAHLADLAENAKEVKQRFAAALSRIGIDLDPAEIDGLLVMATSDSLVDMLAVFENLKAVNDRLLEATIRSNESIAVARRYYGIYVTMLELAVYLHHDFVERIDKTYRPELERIATQTKQLREEARALLARERGSDLAAVMETNIMSQDLTLKTAKLYDGELMRQRESISDSLARVKRQYEVALNTYKTVKLSSDLIEMLRGSSDAFRRILEIKIPAIRPFENSEMQKEFERIRDQLREAPIS